MFFAGGKVTLLGVKVEGSKRTYIHIHIYTNTHTHTHTQRKKKEKKQKNQNTPLRRYRAGT